MKFQTIIYDDSGEVILDTSQVDEAVEEMTFDIEDILVTISHKIQKNG